MLDFAFYSPTRFLFGKGTETKTGEMVREAGGSRVLIHYGGGSIERSGLLGRVTRSLDEAGVNWISLGGVAPNPLDSLIREGIGRCRREGVDLVLGVGGGSALDSAKAIAIGSVYDGDVLDFYFNRKQPSRRLKLGTIITLPGTGSDGSNSSVIVRSSDRLKRGLRSDFNRPDFSIVNPELARSLPPWQVASGAADILSHVFERYFTNTSGVDLTDRLCEAVCQAVIKAAPQAMGNPGDYDSMATLFWSATVAHNGSLGVGREEDWSAHALEHEIGGLYNTTHGAGLAALYPAWLKHHLPSRAGRLAQFAERILDVPGDPDHPEDVALEGIRRLAAFFRSLGLAGNLRELGVRPEDFVAMAARVKRNPDGTCGHFLPLRDADILAIYESAYV
jgi:alcohol dehydrogenase